MRPFTIDFDVDNVDADGLADNNDSSGSSLTLDGALTSGGSYTAADGFGHRINIIDTATVDQSGATFTVTGTDADDNAQTEAITGPTSGATVESTKYFKTITAIAIASGAACGTVDVGTVDEVCTKTYPMNHRNGEEPIAQITLTGTANFDIQVTLENPYGSYTDQEDLLYINDTNFAGKSASVIDNMCVPGIRAMRVVMNSYTNGAELNVTVTHPR